MTYSHRNGETDAPTVAGWYWFEGRRYLNDNMARAVADVWLTDGGYVAKVRAWKTRRIGELYGKWYGPVPHALG